MSAVLERTAFSTSRELEFFSEKELRQQIGYAKPYWPVAILRELIDNALDVANEVKITVADDKIVVADNGPGLPAETLIQSMDYMTRVSDKAYYVAPTRGAMGNALKVIWAAPFVDTGKAHFEVETHGERHAIDVTLDRIAQQPHINHSVESADCKKGTKFTIHWADSSSSLLEHRYGDFLQARDLVKAYAAFNPDATFTLNGEVFERSTDSWSKWRTNDPTPAHWYTSETLRDLIAAYVAQERAGAEPRTVRSFVSEFRGLSSTAKQKAVGWSGQYLHDFVTDGDLDQAFVADLLTAMNKNSNAPKPKALGVIGKDHLTACMDGVAPDSIKYKCFADVDDLPYVIEVAFGLNEDRRSSRRLITGLNWSPVISGYVDNTLAEAVQAANVDPHDPVTMFVHIARARFDFADRGKTRLV